ncbi:MAG: hypothetical protein AABX11_03250 [Nanoarchaeota archaeon]
MTKRKKRLQKGITSVEEQILLHEEKKRQAQELGQEEFVGYYEKEIDRLKDRKHNRKDKLDKQ